MEAFRQTLLNSPEALQGMLALVNGRLTEGDAPLEQEELKTMISGIPTTRRAMRRFKRKQKRKQKKLRNQA
jgi:hypothetical protein